MKQTPALAQNQRAVPRVACAMDAIAHFDCSSQLRCETVDISIQGAQLRFRGDLSKTGVGNFDGLLIPGVDTFHVEMRWIDGSRAGVPFSGPKEELLLLYKLVEHLQKMRREHVSAQTKGGVTDRT
ncbi:hypothetical protein GCM10011415_04680 [Salipiger pallidus]|uniref:PilZ domain-containing protein n=1 Tax=Salipiger pallidus TaxID=1775170 RepID=A0A8J3EFQ9_9RHOB|nr:hypothetical protein [Salipiger pallidus]GGG61620.1 hypothetical protein GCM10011415_04680 [Salipiger pallidus]